MLDPLKQLEQEEFEVTYGAVSARPHTSYVSHSAKA